MKTHKILKVDKAACCAEQKIAYNIAFHMRDHILRLGLIGEQAIDECMLHWSFSPVAKTGKYNVPAIRAALYGGLENYLARSFIARTYEEIGERFPLKFSALPFGA